MTKPDPIPFPPRASECTRDSIFAICPHQDTCNQGRICRGDCAENLRRGYERWHGENSDLSDADRSGFSRPAPLDAPARGRPVAEYPPASVRWFLIAVAAVAFAAWLSSMFPMGVAK